MTGFVDEQLRALIAIPVAASVQGERTELLAWIDTAFNGGLTIPKSRIELLGLQLESSTEAVLADGRTVELETYRCCVDWLGKTYQTQVIANDGAYPLLGTLFLADRSVHIDYLAKTAEVS